MLFGFESKNISYQFTKFFSPSDRTRRLSFRWVVNVVVLQSRDLTVLIVYFALCYIVVPLKAILAEQVQAVNKIYLAL